MERRDKEYETHTWIHVLLCLVFLLQVSTLILFAVVSQGEEGLHLKIQQLFKAGNRKNSKPNIVETSTQPSQKCSGFLCKDYTCVDSSKICDGHIDCPDKSDEDSCVLRPGFTVSSYLDFPRLHFAGKFYSDFTTANNHAKNYDMGNFSQHTLCNGVGDIVDMVCHYEGGNNWDFVDVVVTRVCYSDATCTSNPKSDALIGQAVAGTHLSNPKLVDMDTSVMSMSQIWGWTITLGDVLTGRFAVAAYQHGWLKVPDQIFDSRLGGFFKSTLTNIKWKKSIKKRLRKSRFVHELMNVTAGVSTAPTLSIKFNVDLFNKNKKDVNYKHGRVAGIIGPHGEDSCHMFKVARVMRNKLGPKHSKYFDAPFIVDEDRKLVIVDFGNSLKCDIRGRFASDYMDNGKLYLTILTKSGMIRVGHLDYKRDKWYRATSGVQPFEVKETMLPLIQSSPLGVVRNMDDILLEESADGIVVGVQHNYTFYKHPDDEWNVTFYAYQFGRPLKDVHISLNFASKEDKNKNVTFSMSNEFADGDGVINEPKGALHFTDGVTDERGEASIAFRAGDPGKKPNSNRTTNQLPNAQIYWLLVRYKSPESQRFVLSGDACIVIYLFFKEKVIQHPTWHKDIKPIFSRYAAMYPVMRPIVNLAEYNSVVENIPKIRMSMNLPVSDGNYMPVSRDVSRYTLQTINNWLVNPQLGVPEHPAKVDLEVMLQKALFVELSTIPPYLTGLMSIKPGRNREVYDILKVIAVQEMSHMTLVANILNAIGGKPVLNESKWTPVYPSYGLPGGLRPDLVITLEKLTVDYIQNVFMEIEQPEDVIVSRCKRVSERSRCEKEHYPKTIGQFYKTIQNALVELEDKARKKGGTIFNGDPLRQIGVSHWYTRVVDKPFKISGISDATRAIEQISQEGEGSDACNPLVSSKTSQARLLSHYYKFSQIVHGQYLRVENAEQCVNSLHRTKRYYTARDVPFVHEQDRYVCGEAKLMMCNVTYAYDGSKIPFYEDGVWPIMDNPKTNKYQYNSVARRLSNSFNNVYTKMLKCLHTSFNGNPDAMKHCVGLMETLLVKGSRMVATPIDPLVDSSTGPNVAPTWEFLDKPIDCYDDCPEVNILEH